MAQQENDGHSGPESDAPEMDQKTTAPSPDTDESYNNVFLKVLDKTIEVPGVDRAGILIPDKHSESYVVAYLRTATRPTTSGQGRILMSSPQASSLATGGSVLLTDSPEQFQCTTDDEPLLFCCMVPIRVAQKTVAVLCAGSDSPSDGCEMRLHIVESIARETEQYITNVNFERRDQETRHILERLVDAIQDFLFVLSPDGRILETNVATRENLGLPFHDLRGRMLSELAVPACRDKIKELVNTARSGTPCTEEVSFTGPDGNTHPVIARMESGVFEGMKVLFAILHDKTEKAQYERRLEIRRQLQDFITSISVRLLDFTAEQIEDGVNEILAQLGQLVDVDRVHIYLLSEDGKTLHRAYQWVKEDIGPQISEVAFYKLRRAGKWWTGEDRNKPHQYQNVNDIPADAADIRDQLTANDVKSVATVPMASGSHLVGILGLECVREYRSWDQDTLDLYQLIASVFTSAFRRFDMEKRLRTSEEQYRSIVDTTQDVVYQMDNNGRFMFLNPAWEKLSEYSLEESIGQPAGQFIFHEDLQQILFLINEILLGKLQKVRRQARLVTKSGEIRWLEAHGQTLLDDEGNCISISGIMSDVTEQRQAQQELKRLSEAVGKSVDGVVILDLDGSVEFWNPAWSGMHGYSEQNQYVHHISGFHTILQYSDVIIPALETARQRGSYEGEIGHLRADGTLFPTSMTVTLLHDETGTANGYLCIARDITEQLQARVELEQAKKQAEEANMAKSRFLANMSHEIRTPLNGVIGLTDLTLTTRLDTEQREYLTRANTAAQSLLSLLNDILDVSKIEAGQLQLEQIPFDIGEILETVVESLSQKAQEKLIDFHTLVRKDVPRNLTGDPERIRQVLVNLAGNAIKFTESGHVFVEISKGTTNHDKHVIRLTISDTGIGIPRERLPDIFERFSQADGSVSRKYGGTGLGLAIAKMLSEQMEGTISVSTESGQGSTFVVELPLNNAQQSSEPVRDTAHTNKNILVVDPSLTGRNALGETLASAGYDVDTAPNGDMLPSGNPPYNVILVNPDKDAVDTAWIRQCCAQPNTVVIVLLFPAMRTTRQALLQTGCTQFLTKPVTQSTLIAEVEKAVRGTATDLPDTLHAWPDTPPDTSVGTVLIVEDNETNMFLTRTLLKKAGYDIVTAANGKEALDMLEKHPFDAVLMDLQMPVMDGHTAIQKIRRIPELAGLPVIAMTAHALKGDRERGLREGFTGYLTKPVKRQNLLAAVAQAVSDTGSMPETSTRQENEISHKIFNPDYLSEMLNGEEEVMNSLLQSFYRSAEESVGQIRHALDTHDAAALGRYAHTLKGTAGSYTAERLADAAIALDTACKQDQGDRFDSLVKRIEVEWQELSDYMTDTFDLK